MPAPDPTDASAHVLATPADVVPDAQPLPHTETDTDANARADVRTGLLLAGTAYGWWGLVIPGYMYLMRGSGAYELLAMRILTGVPVVLAILFSRGALGELRRAFTDWSIMRAMLLTTPLIALNWFAFTYSVVEGRLSESSLGYYINPIVSVALGVLVLGERLRPAQWVAVGLAAASVTTLTIAQGSLPLITVTVALSFGLYGLMRKRAKAGPAVGMAIEMILLSPVLLAIQFALVAQGTALFGANLDHPSGWRTTALLSLGGLVTVVPLMCFTAATRKLRLSTIGLMQYVAPTLQLVFAAVVIKESVSPQQLLAFAIIWVGLIVFTIDSMLGHRRAGQNRNPVTSTHPATSADLPESSNA